MEIFEDYTGQESFFPVSTTVSNSVVQANSLVTARQNLTINEAKLLRLIFMQILNDDVEFKPYEISLKDFADLIGNSDCHNFYGRAKDFTDSLQTKKVFIHRNDGSWQSIVWVPTVAYDSHSRKIKIKLNDDLKPYLLNLAEQGYYTQYALENILGLSSVFSLRIFELLMERTFTKVLPRNGVDVFISIADIRDACMLYKLDKNGNPTDEIKFERVSSLKDKVIDVAVREINNNTSYNLSYEDFKQGKSIVGFKFHLDRGYDKVIERLKARA